MNTRPNTLVEFSMYRWGEGLSREVKIVNKVAELERGGALKAARLSIGLKSRGRLYSGGMSICILH